MIQTTTAEKIHFEIQKKIESGSSYIDALIDYAQENNMTEEALGAIIKKSTSMTASLWTEASRLNLLKKKVKTVDIIELCD